MDPVTRAVRVTREWDCMYCNECVNEMNVEVVTVTQKMPPVFRFTVEVWPP